MYLDAPHALCRARRIDRDVRERGRDAADVSRQHAEHVLPMYARNVLPTRAQADLVLDGAAPIEELLQMMLAELRLRQAPLATSRRAAS